MTAVLPTEAVRVTSTQLQRRQSSFVGAILPTTALCRNVAGSNKPSHMSFRIVAGYGGIQDCLVTIKESAIASHAVSCMPLTQDRILAFRSSDMKPVSAVRVLTAVSGCILMAHGGYFLNQLRIQDLHDTIIRLSLCGDLVEVIIGGCVVWSCTKSKQADR